MEMCMEFRYKGLFLKTHLKYKALLYPLISIEAENSKAPTSVLLFYCFRTAEVVDTELSVKVKMKRAKLIFTVLYLPISVNGYMPFYCLMLYL